ncbi:hypothetical protein H9Q13_15120 [Pontibacter sp. JH31]|uniref:Uncharacterized protein n=1 Tax=Pontibacter aquaedesilientis TaxID=2766980 RepID=A0ABR7XJR0_9BACT|nr:hypothetical protein [Pontibacter aquaedesilientis]MBD1398502.1 hypothetical protein [Pontibacter aquaedesilientis]
MAYPPALLNSAARQLQRVFEADHQLASEENELIHQVSRLVLYLLRHNLNQLLHILYRIDVEERKVKQAMLATSEEEVAENIARLIVERELLKAQIRFRYSQN